MVDPDYYEIECSSCCYTCEVMMDLRCELTEDCFIVSCWHLRGTMNHALKCVVKEFIVSFIIGIIVFCEVVSVT